MRACEAQAEFHHAVSQTVQSQTQQSQSARPTEKQSGSVPESHCLSAAGRAQWGKPAMEAGWIQHSAGGALLNSRKGRLNNIKSNPAISCAIKNKSTRNKKPNAINIRAKKPMLSPAGRMPTISPRIRRKNRLYSPHCLVRFLEEIGIRSRFQWVCKRHQPAQTQQRQAEDKIEQGACLRT